MASTLVTIHPNQLQDLPLATIGTVIVTVSAATLYVMIELYSQLAMDIADSGIMDAEPVRVDNLIPDIFDMEDADIPPEFAEWDQETYGRDDFHSIPDLEPEIRDTLPSTPGPIENLATLIENHSNILTHRFDNLRSYLDTAMDEFRFRSPTLNVNDLGYIRQLHNTLLDINDNIRGISRTLYPLMDRTEIWSLYWCNHPELRPGFERIHSSSGVLVEAASNLFQSSQRCIDFLRNLINDLEGGGNDPNL